ncbi:MAG: hypothetical protein K6G47_10505 [Clostridia bacterium]|nr:hypothetical protein [Clostridia bacterium]
MSTVRDRNVLDLVCVENDKYVLIIIDDIEWNFATRVDHAHMLQEKINDYSGYILSGQAEQARPGLRCVIRILAQYSYSQYCIDFLNRFKEYIKANGDFCDLEWTHSEGETGFEDGFSDEYVFDPEKIYPRLRKNWAKNPQEEISLMAVNDSESYPDMPMMRVMDSYVICLVIDAGSVFNYLSYDKIPEGTDIQKLFDKAFDNLNRDIQYRYEESKEKGIFGILCGGNFEAESLCFDTTWKQLSDMLGDDLMIVAPTKDIVFFTKAGDKKRCKTLMKMGSKMFEDNRKNTPFLLFSRDVFIFSRKDGKLQIQKKLSI